MIQVVARRGDSLLIADPDAGRGGIVYRSGFDPVVLHMDSVLATGYWAEASDPMPDLPQDVLDRLAEMNRRGAVE